MSDYLADDEGPQVGRGEFQLRGVHAEADVEIRDGEIVRVRFSSSSEDVATAAGELVPALEGKDLAAALAYTAQLTAESMNRDEATAKTALLEAFHRAVEVCIDGS